MVSVSVIVPVYNSEQSLPTLCKQLSDVLSELAEHYEVILVNDGSSDKSWEVITDLTVNYRYMRGINLMRNYGQHNALLCGIREARFEVIVTIDDDLQHPPAEIRHLLGKLSEGFDVVYGIPKMLPHARWRNLLSKYTKRALSKAMGIKNVRDVNAFRAFRSSLRKAFEDYQSPNLLLDVLLGWGTTRFATIEVEHRPRELGKSNYTFLKLWKQAMLMLTGFSTGPLRLASWIGFGFTVCGVAVFAYVLFLYMFKGSLPGFPFLASIISVFSGAQLFALGIIGEYLARMFDRSLDRPTYVVLNVTEQPAKHPLAYQVAG